MHGQQIINQRVKINACLRNIVSAIANRSKKLVSVENGESNLGKSTTSIGAVEIVER